MCRVSGFFIWLFFIFIGILYLLKTSEGNLFFTIFILGWIIPLAGDLIDEKNEKEK